MNDASPSYNCCLRITTERIRKQLLRVVFNVKSWYSGGTISAVDAITVLYFKVLYVDPENSIIPGRNGNRSQSE